MEALTLLSCIVITVGTLGAVVWVVVKLEDRGGLMAEWTLAKVVAELEDAGYFAYGCTWGEYSLVDDPAFIALKDIARVSEPSTLVHFATHFDKLMREGYCW